MSRNKKSELYSLKDVSYGYKQNFSLSIPHFAINKGDSIGVTGPNGSGKSTLLKLLAFLERPNSGVINFYGNDGNSPRREDATLLLQEHYLLKRSVFDNIAFGLKIRKKKNGIRARVEEALEMVGLDPAEFARRYWNELSGGEARRVSLASRLALKTGVLLLDEPVANIDRDSSCLIKDTIAKIRAEGRTTLIISSHDHLWLSGLTDSVVQMHEGAIIGHHRYNIIKGPWREESPGLWSSSQSNAGKIYALRPPHADSTGILDPHNIIISEIEQGKTSARNNLKGTIRRLEEVQDSPRIRAEVECSGMVIMCSVSYDAAETLKLLPGKDVWLIFKASSIEWK